MVNSVDKFYDEAVELIQELTKLDQPSLLLTATNNLRKSLLLAVASQFEHTLCEIVQQFVRERTPASPLVENFVRNKAIARQYHTWFTWDASNANNFFGLFGEDFKTSMKKRCSESEELKSSIEAFLELGNTRNQLVHRDYVSFPLEKTLDELYTLYRAATVFVTNLPTFLAAHDKTGETTSPA